jgi:hypothetical protein
MTTDKRASAAARLGLHDADGQLNLNKRSVLGAVGGWFGIVEAILPSMVFVILLALFNQTVIAVVSAVSVSAAFLLIQIIRKKPITQAIAGAVGIAISAFLPLREGGQAADYFIQGFITNSIYLAVLVLSVLVRWPAIGVLVGIFLGDGNSWRRNKGQMRRFQAATLLWITLFASRLLVQVPLYFAQATEVLGLFRIAMGVPLYALCIWLTWLMVRSVITER